MKWPALIFSSDFLPGHAPLNGRRWVSQLLFKLWLEASVNEGLDLLVSEPSVLEDLRSSLDNQHQSLVMRCCSITDPRDLIDNGGLFIPDPSIGSWSAWRQSAGHRSFSIIGQIHTLSTTVVMGMLDSLVFEPVQEWDALICSSTAGRTVVERLMDDRIEQLKHRCGAQTFPRPQLPVIPLPLDESCFEFSQYSRNEARQKLGLPLDAHVVLWLGRRSMLTKADPWPSYRVLQRSAQRLGKPIWVVECGPDDTPEQGRHFLDLQKLCPDLRFLRLGGSSHVPEDIKRKALIACDLVLSLVDNIQETFGLSIAEAMAAGRPVVASDWDGYRDLIRNGIDGYLVPSCWHEQANHVSFPLGWMQKNEFSNFPFISGSLAQLVQLDLEAAEAAVSTLLCDPKLSLAMGNAARCRALEQFHPNRVMLRYRELFSHLTDLRLSSENTTSEVLSPPLRFDPVRCFANYASHQKSVRDLAATQDELPSILLNARQPFFDQLSKALPSDCHPLNLKLLQRLKHG